MAESIYKFLKEEDLLDLKLPLGKYAKTQHDNFELKTLRANFRTANGVILPDKRGSHRLPQLYDGLTT